MLQDAKMLTFNISQNASVFKELAVIKVCISVHLAFAENEKGRSQMNASTAIGLR